MLRKLFLLITLIWLLQCSAAIYQSVGPTGNITYSNHPYPGTTQIHSLPTANTVKQPQVLSSKTNIGTPKHHDNTVASPQIRYTVFKIANIKDQQNFHNQRQIIVKIQVYPRLKKANQIALWLDGKPYTQQSNTRFVLDNLDRGTHQLQARLITKSGKMIETTSILTIYIDYHNSTG